MLDDLLDLDSLDSQDPSFQKPSLDSVKFELFIKVREVEELHKSLGKISFNTRKERVIWLHQYKQTLAGMLDEFAQESLQAIDGMQVDSESMQLSLHLMSRLRETLLMVNSLLEVREPLKG